MDNKELLTRIDQLCRLAGAACTKAKLTNDNEVSESIGVVYRKAAALRQWVQENMETHT